MPGEREQQQQQQQWNSTTELEQQQQPLDFQCNNNKKFCEGVVKDANSQGQIDPRYRLKCDYKPSKGGLSFTDKYLSVFILVTMIVGVVLGNFRPQFGAKLAVAEISKVSLPIAFGLWFMMYPVLCKVQYDKLGAMFKEKFTWHQILFSLVANWIVGPLVMLGLAWATLPDLPFFRNGVILVGLARCIAMVLIWNQLARGQAEFCAILVAINSILQIVLYAPLTLLYLQVISRQYLSTGLHISFWDVFRSVLLFLGVPLGAALVTRYGLIAIIGREKFDKYFIPWVSPLAFVALLWTIFAMFTLQGEKIIHEIGSVFRVAVPLILYFMIIWSSNFYISYRYTKKYEYATTQAFTASSNNFELAIAIAVGTFGIQSSEALAATVGPLIEIPVMLLLVQLSLFCLKKTKKIA